MTEQTNPAATEQAAPVTAAQLMLPCPFCGSANVDPEGWASCGEPGTPMKHGPACDDCGGCTDTVERWNNRTTASGSKLHSIAKALGAYALNVAYGQELAPFEQKHLVEIAASIGCKVLDQHLAFNSTRHVLAELLKERRKQVEQLGFTAEHDARNPERLREQVLERVQAMPTEHERFHLIQAAAIIVAEIEMIDRKHV